MKYVVILGDGMADYPVDAFDGKTILEVADKPTIDYMAQHGEMGMVKTVQDGMKPGSDVANLLWVMIQRNVTAVVHRLRRRQSAFR